MSDKPNGRELLLRITLGVASTALMLLIGVVAFIGREGLRKMDTLAAKIDGVNQGMNENRTRIIVLEENRKQMEKALDNQLIIIRELQQLNRNVIRGVPGR